MATLARPAVPWHLWAVGILTLLWNAVGVVSYLLTQTGNLAAVGMTPQQIAYFNTFPAWAHAVWALGVWGAFAGSLLILLRSRWAVAALLISVAGMIGTTFFQYAVADVPADLRNPALDAAIWIITLGTLWYAWTMRRRGVLR